MANEVVVCGESGNLSVKATALDGSPEMEFRSGSFKGTVDERRVCVVFMTIPSLSKNLTLRFEFTDPGFSDVDLLGAPTRVSELQTVDPYREPRSQRRMEEGR